MYERLEFSLVSERGHPLKCSYFAPGEDAKADPTPRPCVVYLHGMSGCRLDVFSLLPFLLKYDITVCSVDFSGCGESGGDYVSLGYHESRDLRVVLDHIRGFPSVTCVALWGWSMGAVAAILRASEDDTIAACVLDSPFSDLSTVFREVVDAALPTLPNMLVSLGIQIVRHEAQKRANFDPSELRPIDCAPKAACPALFGVAKDDLITRPGHAQELFKAWGGTKRIASFEGDHNSKRPDSFLRDAAKFLWHNFQIRAVADCRPIPETPEADTVFLVEPGGAFHRSMSNRDDFCIPRGLAFRRPSSDRGSVCHPDMKKPGDNSELTCGVFTGSVSKHVPIAGLTSSHDPHSVVIMDAQCDSMIPKCTSRRRQCRDDSKLCCWREQPSLETS
jgi:pimeloyl-ACP methyl ester carboxylesterase